MSFDQYLFVNAKFQVVHLMGFSVFCYHTWFHFNPGTVRRQYIIINNIIFLALYPLVNYVFVYHRSLKASLRRISLCKVFIMHFGALGSLWDCALSDIAMSRDILVGHWITDNTFWYMKYIFSLNELLSQYFGTSLG